MALRSDLVVLLNLMKGSVTFGRLVIEDRQKNRQGLIDLGITANDRCDLLLGLCPEDYCNGPKQDDEVPDKEVWEFGIAVNGIDVYIKFRIVEDPRRKGDIHTVLWSFHPAESALTYPLKEGGGS